MMQRLQDRAFTIVELMIVIVVIVILASITAVAYISVQDQASYSRAASDMKHINDAILVYKAQNGNYPVGNSTFQPASTALASLAPGYLDSADILTAESGYSYLYRSDTGGTNYKLLRTTYNSTHTLKEVETTDNDLMTTAGTYANNAWGYWSAGGASW